MVFWHEIWLQTNMKQEDQFLTYRSSQFKINMTCSRCSGHLKLGMAGGGERELLQQQSES